MAFRKHPSSCAQFDRIDPIRLNLLPALAFTSNTAQHHLPTPRFVLDHQRPPAQTIPTEKQHISRSVVKDKRKRPFNPPQNLNRRLHRRARHTTTTTTSTNRRRRSHQQPQHNLAIILPKPNHPPTPLTNTISTSTNPPRLAIPAKHRPLTAMRITHKRLARDMVASQRQHGGREAERQRHRPAAGSGVDNGALDLAEMVWSAGAQGKG
jgi:hypothetical protein